MSAPYAATAGDESAVDILSILRGQKPEQVIADTLLDWVTALEAAIRDEEATAAMWAGFALFGGQRYTAETADSKSRLAALRAAHDAAVSQPIDLTPAHERALALANCAELLAEVNMAIPAAATSPLRKQLAEATAPQLVEKRATNDLTRSGLSGHKATLGATVLPRARSSARGKAGSFKM